MTRTVYDGDQVLYDIRTQADTVGEGSESEGSGTAFTGVVGYTHAGGIDAPLGLFKGTDRVWTLTGWRGQYDLECVAVRSATTAHSVADPHHVVRQFLSRDAAD